MMMFPLLCYSDLYFLINKNIMTILLAQNVAYIFLSECTLLGFSIAPLIVSPPRSELSSALRKRAPATSNKPSCTTLDQN